MRFRLFRGLRASRGCATINCRGVKYRKSESGWRLRTDASEPVRRRHAQHHCRRSDSFPFKNKTAEANLAGARIQKEQLQASMRSQEQLIEVDVRNSAQAVESARQRVLSAREARTNAEMQLEGEQRLYQVGRSTTFLLFQRENALANARASELRAETDYNKALADLQRATSTTLRANNVVVDTPVQP